MIFRNFWVISFALFCFILYEQGMRKRNTDYRLLNEQKITLESKIAEARLLNEELTLKHHSQSDPAWVELTLMRELGLVPEGHTKIIFTESSTN